MIHTKKLSSDQHGAAQDFYATVGYQITVQPDDYVVAAYAGDCIVGIVRLSYDHDAITLRGMMVAPDYQRQGIGTQLLRTLSTVIGSQICWCLPHGWLEGFYGQIGFVKIDERQAPLFLQERIALGRQKWPHMMVMVKNYPE
jgi:N-acetylglutamate synthase-like GNAT family acetyltransferase